MTLTLNVHAQTWKEVSKIVASDREYTAWFGRAVSISGHYAIVGAYLKDNENADQNFLLDEGAAYIYEKNPTGNWILVQKITASDKNEFDWFGCSVGISGSYAIIGAYVEDEDQNGENTMEGAGSAYIFEKNESGVWMEVQKIVASDRFFSDSFGFSVAISDNYAIVGATNSNAFGAAYLFKRDDQGHWNEVQRIEGDFPTISGIFGHSVSIHDSLAIVGAPYENAGAAYIFKLDATGIWNRAQKLVVPSWDDDDLYGNSVSISGDYAIVGSPWEDEDAQEGDSLFRAGAAYIYERDGSNNWNLAKKIVPTDRASYDEYGYSVSISGDMAAVGAPMNDIDDEDDTHFTIGSTYVFKRNSSGNWEEMTNIFTSDWDYTDQFGIAVAISGNYLIGGSYYEMEDASGGNPLIQAGSAYVFSYCATVENPMAESVCFGDSLFLGGDYQSIAGTYYDTLRASTGCDSVIVTDLTVVEVDTVVTLAGTTLTASATNASYQWIDCNADQIIQGETNKNFTVDTEGTYAVEITQEGCIDTSFCRVVTIVGLSENTFGAELKVYPNPTNNHLYMTLGHIYPDLDVQVLNLAGNVVMKRHYKRQQTILLNLESLPSGLYFIQLKTTKRNAILRVMKDR